MSKTTRLYRLVSMDRPYLSIDNVSVVTVPTGKLKNKKPVMENKYVFSSIKSRWTYLTIDEVNALIEKAFEFGLESELGNYELRTYQPREPYQVANNLTLAAIRNRIGQKRVIEKLKGTS